MVRDCDSAVMLPKAASAQQVVELLRVHTSCPSVIALVESAAGIMAATDICSTPKVTRIAFGSADLGAELGVDPANRTALLFAPVCW